MPNVRGHNEGSLFLRSRDRRWVATVTMPNGRRRSMSARSKAEGVLALRELLRQRDAAVPQDPRQVRLGPYLARWLDEVRPRLAPATWRKHESIVRVHLGPALGHRRLSELSVGDVRGYLDHAAGDPQSTRHHRATLRRALADGTAVRRGAVTCRQGLCGGYPLASGWCWAHDPDREEERLRARQRLVQSAKASRQRRLRQARERDGAVREYVVAAREATEDLLAARAIIGLRFVQVSAVRSAVGPEPEG
jgi:hypothetical protein